jgi:8-oxo-dGTP diphosphatase
MKRIRTVGCFMESDGKFLILRRHPHKSQGDTWALPAGKVNPGETDNDAIIREIREETGYRATDEELEFLGNHIFRIPNLEVTFPTFRIMLQKPLQVVHSEQEHTAYRWVTPEECCGMPNLIYGLKDLLEWTGYTPPTPNSKVPHLQPPTKSR